MAELHERVAVKTQPRNIALFGRPDEGRRARAELAALRVADKAIALFREVPFVARSVTGFDVIGQEAVDQVERQLARLAAYLGILVLEHHVVDAGPTVDRSGPAEGYVGTGHDLQFDRDVLHDVTEPGTFVLTHATHEAAGLLVGAPVLVQAGQLFEQRLDKCIAQAARRPVFEFLEIEYMTNDRKAGKHVRPDIDVGALNLHSVCLLSFYSA